MAKRQNIKRRKIDRVPYHVIAQAEAALSAATIDRITVKPKEIADQLRADRGKDDPRAE